MRSSNTNWFFLGTALFALGTAASGCSFDAALDVTRPGGPPTAATGTLTQRWSIGGQFNERFCVTYGADRMQLVIRDRAGALVARAFQPCEEMEMSVTLAEGSYTGDAWLIGADGERVSTTLPLRPFRIARGTETFIDTDFPVSSLLTAFGALASSEPGDAVDEAD